MHALLLTVLMCSIAAIFKILSMILIYPIKALLNKTM